MARRRVQSQLPLGETQNFNQSDVLTNLGNLATISTLLSGQQGLRDVPDMRGTAQEENLPEEIDIPQIPMNPELYEDQYGVDDVPGIPEGIELLGDLAGIESEEDAYDSVTETQPPIHALPQTPEGGLQDPLEFIKQRVSEEPSLMQDLPEETRGLIQPQEDLVEDQLQIEDQVTSDQEFVGPPLPPALQEVFDRGEIVEDVKEEDIPNEGLEAIPGVVEQASKDEKVKKVVRNLLNLKKGDFPKEAWDYFIMTSKALTEEKKDLDGTALQIRERLEKGDLTTLDKVAIGVAISIPVIMGLMYGKEAFLSSLGGSTKGFTESIKEQGKEIDKLREKLGSIDKRSREIQLKKAELRKELVSSVENPEMRKLLNNYDVIDVVEDENGEPQVVLGEDAEIFGDNVGIRAPTEAGEALYYDADLLRNDEAVKNFNKNMNEGMEEYQAAKNSNRLIDEITGVMGIIKKQDPNLLSKLAQYIQPSKAGVLGLVVPDNWRSLTIDIVDDNGQVKKVLAMPLLNQYITALQDPYNKEYLGGTRLTEGVIQHWRSVFPNPDDIKAWLTSDYDTMTEQSKAFKSILNQRISDNLVGKGFLREPLEQKLETQSLNILNSPYIDAKSKKQILSLKQDEFKREPNKKQFGLK